MKVNKSEVVDIVFALISVTISSYSVGLMPRGIRKSMYELIISVAVFVMFLYNS
jgi:hypothetical protein